VICEVVTQIPGSLGVPIEKIVRLVNCEKLGSVYLLQFSVRVLGA
jgi:hypothetical protein